MIMTSKLQVSKSWLDSEERNPFLLMLILKVEEKEAKSQALCTVDITRLEKTAAIPSGCFQMGSGEETDDQKPVHEVCLTSFEIDIYEVTVAQYEKCVVAGKARV